MPYFRFRQNNSGGSFIKNAKVDVLVIIQAKDAAQANDRAEEVGIYFNGCEKGYDCECCGDRWYPVSDGSDYCVMTPAQVRAEKSAKVYRNGRFK
jgi:hypothetical protein